MKKGSKILLGFVLFIGIMIGGISLFMRHQINQTYRRLDEVEIVDLSEVEDGTYEGIEETDLVKVTVVVTVKDHQITDIQLIRHENGKGTPAEAIKAAGYSYKIYSRRFYDSEGRWKLQFQVHF